jgi:DNA damage-inducible protein 1
MRFTVANDDDVLSMDMDGASVTVAQLKAHLADFGCPPAADQVLIMDGKPLQPDTATLSAAGITEDSVLMVVPRAALQQQGGGGGGGGGLSATSTPQDVANHAAQAAVEVKERLSNDTDGSFLQQLIENDQELMDAALNTDPTRLQALLQTRIQARVDAARAEQHRISSLATADPFDMDAQTQIAEEIRKHNVEENMESALEQLPEAFASVTMLYVDILVNDVPVKAFVDSGAQSTIVSKECAERCGIMRLIDQRYAGVAMGVGTAKILGKVHVAPIRIGKSHFPSSFTVLDDNKVDFLLGLDMLRRHQCAIDLRENVLRIGDEVVPFLAEKDIPAGAFGGPRNDDDQQQQQASQQQQQSPPEASSGQPAPASPAPNPATPPPASPQVDAQPLLLPSGVSSESVDKLMGLTNQPRDQVIRALELANGNEELAASELLGLF